MIQFKARNINGDICYYKKKSNDKLWVFTNVKDYINNINKNPKDKVISCTVCDWSWKAVDGGKDLLDCHKCGGVDTGVDISTFENENDYMKKFFKGGEVSQYNKWKSIDWSSFLGEKYKSKIYRLIGWIISDRIDLSKVSEKNRNYIEDIKYNFQDELNLEYTFEEEIEGILKDYDKILEDESLEKYSDDIAELDKATTALLNSKKNQELKNKMIELDLSEKDLKTKSQSDLVREVSESKDIEFLQDYILLNSDRYYDFHDLYFDEDKILKLYDYLLDSGAVFTEEMEAQQYDIFEEVKEDGLSKEIDVEVDILKDLLIDAKEENNNELISELKDRIDFLEELRDDYYRKGGSIKSNWFEGLLSFLNY